MRAGSIYHRLIFGFEIYPPVGHNFLLRTVTVTSSSFHVFSGLLLLGIRFFELATKKLHFPAIKRQKERHKQMGLARAVVVQV